MIGYSRATNSRKKAFRAAHQGFVVAFGGLCAIVLFMGSAFAQADSGTLSIEQVIERREWMTALLDSLELEKQIQKREGKDIARLEAFSKAVKDSLALIRERISTAEPAPNGSGTITSIWSGSPISLPSNPFDWLIVGIGAAAILSGVVLLVGLLGAWIRGSKKKRKAKFAATASEKFTQKQTIPAPEVPEPPSRPIPPTDELPRITTPSREGSDTDLIRNIRTRINQEAVSGRTRPPTTRLKQEAIPPRDHSPTTRITRVVPSVDAQQQRANILAAAAQGLDSHQIAKRLHISEDQVALVLRMRKGSSGES